MATLGARCRFCGDYKSMDIDPYEIDAEAAGSLVDDFIENGCLDCRTKVAAICFKLLWDAFPQGLPQLELVGEAK